MLLPTLVVLLALSLWAVGVVGAQLRCIDASRSAARALARGEQTARAVAAARAVAPRGAVVRVSRQADLVAVEVRATRSLPGPWGAAGPGVDIGSRAVALVER